MELSNDYTKYNTIMDYMWAMNITFKAKPNMNYSQVPHDKDQPHFI